MMKCLFMTRTLCGIFSLVVASWLFGSCHRSEKAHQTSLLDSLKILEEFLKKDTIKAGRGIDDVVVGQEVKVIIRSVGQPEAVLTRNQAKHDSVYYVIADTTVFFPMQYDFDTVYYFEKNRYGLGNVYSKNGHALVLMFSYMHEFNSAKVYPEGILYMETTAGIKKAMNRTGFLFTPKDDPLLKEFGIAEDKIEHLYFFDAGINFELYQGRMTDFTIYSPADIRRFDNLIKAIGTK